MGFHVFSVQFLCVGIVGEHEPESFHTDVLNRVVFLVEVVGDWLVTLMFDVSQVFFESGAQCASSFTNVEFGALCAVDDIDDIVGLAVEMFGDRHVRFGASDVSGTADEGASGTVRLVAGGGAR